MMSKKDYFFYEWLIVGKRITEEKFRWLKPSEMETLKAEYDEFTKIPKIKICTKCHFVFDTPDTHGKGCMCLPEGKMCNDCAHYTRCKALGVIRQEPQTTCDWWPIRFVQAKQCRVCGCSEYHACPGGCYWVDEDLCSKCIDKAKADKQGQKGVI